MNHKIKKLLDSHEQDEAKAARCCKPWMTKRFKFLWLHLYRKPMYLKMDNAFDIKSGWDKKIKKLCPIQWWIREEMQYLWLRPIWKLKQGWYEFKCWLSPWNVIKIKTLPNTYSDPSNVLVHAMFAVVERFFDEEPDKIVCYNGEPDKTFWREINKARDWWLARDIREEKMSEAYEIVHARPREMCYSEKYKEVIELEAQYDKELEENLQLILKYRNFLWT